MGPLRNIRLERFIREYAMTGKPSESYAKAYGLPKSFTTASNAWRVLNASRYGHAQVRLQELREEMTKKADITVDRILSDYQHALELAKAQEKPADIVQAATAQAKLVGLLKDRVENTVTLEEQSPEEILQAVAKECGQEAAQSFAKALGLDQPPEDTRELEQAKPASDLVN